MLDLSVTTDPTFDFKLPDGTAKSYDLWDVYEKVRVASQKAADAAADQAAWKARARDGEPNLGPEPVAVDPYDAIRSAFGFPTAAEAAKSGAFTPTRGQCSVLSAAVAERVEELPHLKKQRGAR
jgi:hypothetical protein